MSDYLQLPTAQLDNGSIIEAADATKAQIAEAVMMAAGAALTHGTLVLLIFDEADEV